MTFIEIPIECPCCGEQDVKELAIDFSKIMNGFICQMSHDSFDCHHCGSKYELDLNQDCEVEFEQR